MAKVYENAKIQRRNAKPQKAVTLVECRKNECWACYVSIKSIRRLKNYGKLQFAFIFNLPLESENPNPKGEMKNSLI